MTTDRLQSLGDKCAVSDKLMMIWSSNLW